MLRLPAIDDSLCLIECFPSIGTPPNTPTSMNSNRLSGEMEIITGKREKIGFTNLPNEIILLIFSYLPNYSLLESVAAVCREWRYFAYTILHYSPQIFDHGLQQTRRPARRSSYYHRSNRYSDELQQQQQQRNREENYDDGGDDVGSATGSEGHSFVRSLWSMMCHLSTTGGGGGNSGSGGQFLRPVDRWNLFLSTIDSADSIDHNTTVAASPLFGIVPVALFIRKLELGCRQQLPETSWLRDKQLSMLVNRCVNLQHLNVSGCTELSDTPLLELARVKTDAVNQLLTLNLSNCTGLTDRALEALADSCQQLRTLNLNGCSQLTDRSVLAIARLTALRRLRLNGCHKLTDQALWALTSGPVAQSLQWLDCGQCPALTCRGLLRLSRLHRLQWLDISQSLISVNNTTTTNTANTTNTTTTSPTPLLLGQRHQQLIIRNTNSPLHPPATVASHQNDYNPLLTDCSDSSVTMDDAIIALVDNCHELELMDLSYLTALTDRALCHVANTAITLKSLSLKGLPEITGRSILQLGELRRRHRRLIWLQIYNCRHINSQVIDEMIKRLNDGWRKGPYDTSVHRDVMNGRSWDDAA